MDTKYKQIKIYFGGDSDFFPFILKMFGSYFDTVIQVDNIKSADIVYWIYGYGPNIRNFPAIWHKRKPLLITHWIGTDAQIATQNLVKKKYHKKAFYWYWNNLVKKKTRNNSMVNLATASWLQDELNSIGISSTYFPITYVNRKKFDIPETLPDKEYDFYSYVPSNRFDFYGGSIIINLAKKFPNYKFVITQPDLEKSKADGSNEMPPNILFLKKVSYSKLNEIYLKTKCFLRLTPHDGLSQAVLESLYFKHQVFWTYKFAYVNNVVRNNFETLSEAIDNGIQNWKPNEEGHNYVKNYHSLQYCIQQFNEVVENLILPKLKGK